ncbi:hypothetical protein [Zavarzinia sp. CC-PAN008]|uniref:hypothetical protein n=1 Tax=Zavarzinia sp. CC-PAN008 TaxID=3243332 RepID=UPI003F747478
MEERAPGPPFKARRPPAPPAPLGARSLRHVTAARVRLGPAANDNPAPLRLKVRRAAIGLGLAATALVLATWLLLG